MNKKKCNKIQLQVKTLYFSMEYTSIFFLIEDNFILKKSKTTLIFLKMEDNVKKPSQTRRWSRLKPTVMVVDKTTTKTTW